MKTPLVLSLLACVVCSAAAAESPKAGEAPSVLPRVDAPLAPAVEAPGAAADPKAGEAGDSQQAAMAPLESAAALPAAAPAAEAVSPTKPDVGSELGSPEKSPAAAAAPEGSDASEVAVLDSEARFDNASARRGPLAAVKDFFKSRQRLDLEAAAEPLRRIHGVVSSRVDKVHAMDGWTIPAVLVDVHENVDMEALKKAIAADPRLRSQTQVNLGVHTLYAVASGKVVADRPIKQGMELSRMRPSAIYDHYRGRLHMLPGVEGVALEDVMTKAGPGIEKKGLVVSLRPGADVAAVAKAFEPMRYSGLILEARLGRFTAYRIEDGVSSRPYKLDARMALSKVHGARAFLRAHRREFLAIDGVASAVKAVHFGDAEQLDLTLKPGAGLAKVKAGLEPFRWGGQAIGVLKNGRQVYLLDGHGGAKE